MESLTDTNPLQSNKDLADILAMIASYYTISKDVYRARSFGNSSAAIAQYPYVILSGKQAREEIKGIGASTEEVIDEFINTGSVKRLNDLENKFVNRKKVVDYFKSFYGIGPVTANKFYDLGYRTLEDLWFDANLNDAQKIGILWRNHIATRIDRSEMKLINDKLHSLLDPYKIKFEIAGSYRRE